MKCPICDNQLPDDVLRCAHCGSTLTVWKNLDMYADQAYHAALDLVRRGERSAATEMIARSVIFAPADSRYLDAYGRLLAQTGRWAEALAVLEKAFQSNRSAETKAALDRVRSLMAAAEVGTDGPTTDGPTTDEASPATEVTPQPVRWPRIPHLPP